MADSQTVHNLATLTSELAHLKEALEATNVEVKELQEYKAKTERYGFFPMGMVALGTMIASGFEKVVNKVMGVFP